MLKTGLSLFLQLLLLFATMMVSFLDRPFYVVAKMNPSSHCPISHWLRNSSKEKSLFPSHSNGSPRADSHWPRLDHTTISDPVNDNCNLSPELGGINPTQNIGTEGWGREDSQADSRRGSDAVWVKTILP